MHSVHEGAQNGEIFSVRPSTFFLHFRSHRKE